MREGRKGSSRDRRRVEREKKVGACVKKKDREAGKREEGREVLVVAHDTRRSGLFETSASCGAQNSVSETCRAKKEEREKSIYHFMDDTGFTILGQTQVGKSSCY